MIADAINSALSDMWAKVVSFFSLSFLDPFYHWLLLGLFIIAIVCVVSWFFGSLWPTLRAIGGVVILIITFGLYAYAKGEKEARDHDRPKRRK